MRTEYNRVEMGEIVLSTEVARRIDPLAISLALRRHSFGRWGKLSPVERAINDHAGSRGVFSIHETKERREFWIITAAGTCSILVLSTEIESRLNQAWEGCFDEYGDADEREFEKCRWNAVKDRLDWSLNSQWVFFRNTLLWRQRNMKGAAPIDARKTGNIFESRIAACAERASAPIGFFRSHPMDSGVIT